MFVAFAGAVVASTLSGLQPAPLDANQVAVPEQSVRSTLCPGLKPVALTLMTSQPGLIRAGYLEHRKTPRPLTSPDVKVTLGCFDIETDDILELQAEAFNRRLGVSTY